MELYAIKNTRVSSKKYPGLFAKIPGSQQEETRVFWKSILCLLNIGAIVHVFQHCEIG